MPCQPCTSSCSLGSVGCVVDVPTYLSNPSGLKHNTLGLNASASGVYAGDFVVGGCGTRQTGGGTFNITIPANTLVTKAILYWNVFVNVCAVSASGLNTITLNAISQTADTTVGWVGNTCWARDPCDLIQRPEMTNIIYSKDVSIYVDSVQVIGGAGSTYTIAGLPVTLCEPDLDFIPGSNNARFPGDRSSQGACLLVIWEYTTGFGPTSGSARYKQVSVYDGAVLMSSMPIVGNDSFANYTFNHTTEFYDNLKIGLVAGDAQDFGDSVKVNGVTVASELPGTTGNLLSINSYVFGSGPLFATVPTNTTSINMVSGQPPTYSDCVDPFLLVFSGNACRCCARIMLTPTDAFTINGGSAQATRQVTANVILLSDPCSCAHTDIAFYSVDGATAAVVPTEGFCMAAGQFVDITLKPIATCQVCQKTGPFCGGSSMSSGCCC